MPGAMRRGWGRTQDMEREERGRWRDKLGRNKWWGGVAGARQGTLALAACPLYVLPGIHSSS